MVKDINIRPLWKKIVYYLGWLVVVMSLLWIIVVLALYYKNKDKEQKRKPKKDLLTKGYQKFAWWMGAIDSVILILAVVFYILLGLGIVG